MQRRRFDSCPFNSSKNDRRRLGATSLSLWLAVAAAGASFAIAAPFSARSNATSQAPPPLVRYTFDEQDEPVPNHGSLGNGAEGDISGSSQFVASSNGFALTLTGTNSVEPDGSDDTFDVADADFSMFARVRTTGGLSGDRLVASKRDNNGRGYALFVNAFGAPKFEVGGSQIASVVGSTDVADGASHELLAVRQGNTLKLYVDGLLEAQIGFSDSGSPDNSRALRIGEPSGGSGLSSSFVGEIDEFALFDRAVTPIDVGGGTDCNGNGVNDALEVASGAASDCDGDGILDVCEGTAAAGDCNANGLCDAQELAQELAPDVDLNGVPDDCQPWWTLPYGIDRMIVFGDSLSDTGNVFALTQGAKPESPPNFQGRFSNGRVWCEYLAGYLGLAPNQVSNFAFGGAASGDTNSLDVQFPTANLPGLADEVAAYAQLVQAGQAPTPSTLFAVWIGANDFNALQNAGSGLQLDTLVHGAMDNIEGSLRQLVQLGARK